MLLFEIKVVLSHHTSSQQQKEGIAAVSVCARTLISPLCFMQLTPNL